jgi:phage protein D/phage baseplate assembly protein gpV
VPDVVKPKVEVAGTVLAPEIDALIEQIVVDDSHVLPDMFTLRFRDPEHIVLDRAGLAIGAKVRIFAGPVGGSATTLLILGEVTALEAEIDETGTHLIARGYDLLHRLQRGLNTRTFVDTTEGDIVRRVAQEAGLTIGEIEDTPGNLPFVSQANQTNLEFLRARAREVGFDLSMHGDQLYFQPPISSSTAPVPGSLRTDDPLALVFGANLNAFLPRITAAEQVGEVEVRGWDPDNQQAVVASAKASTTSVDTGSLTPASVAQTFGDAKYVVGDRPLRDSDSVQRVANSVAEQIGSAFAEADGIADGDPALRAGTPISIAGVGKPFEGQYTITASRHVIGAGGYRTHFTVSGRQERSLLGLASLGGTAGAGSAGGEPIYGVVVAIVTDCNDPTNSGRVKLKFPWLSDDYESDWARLVAPGAGADRGVAFVPEVTDEVLVAFERGDVRSPFVLGGLWSAKNAPPKASELLKGGSVNERVLTSRLGHTIVLSDNDGADGISLLSKDGSYAVSVNAGAQTVELKAPSCTIDMKADGSVTVQAMQIEIKGTSISIKADASLSLSGASVSISSQGPATISGTPLALN